jgi:hypothetical protein
VDDLTAYVLKYYGRFMTPLESKAQTLLIFEEMNTVPGRSKVEQLRTEFAADLDSIRALLAQGNERFLSSVRDRILKDHGAEVFLNRCARCGALTRTPVARQCISCGHDWH